MDSQCIRVNKHNHCNGDLKHVLKAEEQNKTHAHDCSGCGKDFVCLLEVIFAPDNTIKVMSSRSLNIFALFLGRRRPPRTKSTCIPIHPPVGSAVAQW